MSELHDECGVIGLFSTDASVDIVEETYLSLYALQHRGQVGAGIAVNNNGTIIYHKDHGMIPEALPEKELTRLGQGNIKQGVMILSYAGIPIYLVSDYDMDQIYLTIIDCKCRNGESKSEISLWLASQPMEPELRKEINHHLEKIA